MSFTYHDRLLVDAFRHGGRKPSAEATAKQNRQLRKGRASTDSIRRLHFPK
jgi:hypothetical protein